jgi:hypothetical protein
MTDPTNKSADLKLSAASSCLGGSFPFSLVSVQKDVASDGFVPGSLELFA